MAAGAEERDPHRDAAGSRLTGDELTGRAGTFGDPLRALLLEPGVAHVLSGANAAVVRGLPPSATQYLLDGVRMPALAHLLVGPGVVHPDFVESLDFHRGSKPARFGRGLGGVVELGVAGEATTGAARRPRFSAQLDLLNLAAFGDTELAPGLQLTAAGRFGYSPWLGMSVMNLMSSPTDGRPDSDLVAEVYDYQLRVRQQLRGGGGVRLLAFGSSDRGGMRGEGDSVVLGSSSHRADVRITLPVFAGTLLAGAMVGRDALDVDGAGGPTSKLFSTLSEVTYSARAEYRAPLGASWALRVGGDVERRIVDLDQSTVLHPGPATDPARPTVETRVLQALARATFAGAYAQAELDADRWKVTPGVRVDAYDRDDQAPAIVVEPRLLAAHRLGAELTLRGSAGLYHQPPAYLIELPAAAAANLPFGLQRAFEVGAGADYRLGPALLSLDGFARPYAELQELSLGDLDFFAPDLAERAEQRRESEVAFGFELGASSRLSERLAVRGAYSFVSSQRTAELQRRDLLGEVVATERATYAGALVQSHVFNASARFDLGAGFVAAANLHFNTGAPEAGNLASFTHRHGTDPATGAPRWQPVDRDQVARLPSFFRVDARIARQWATGALTWEAWLDVLNLSLQREVFRFNYGVKDGAFEKGPFGIPPITLPFIGVKVSG